MKELLRKLHKTFKGPTLLAAAIFALAGGGFVLTTLILSRTLDTVSFAHATLLIAICNVGIAVAPSGIDGIVLRHDLRADARLSRIAGVLAIATATIAAVIAEFVYELGAFPSTCLALAVATGGWALAVKSSLQRDHHFQRAMMLSQSANIGLLAATGIMWLGIGRNPWFPILTVAVWFVGVGAVSWKWAVSRPHRGESVHSHLWRDGANFVGVTLASGFMQQMERLLIPLALGVHDLALFAVLAAFMLAPYRMLEMGAASTLTARLRATPTVLARRRLLLKEALTLLPLAAMGAVALIALSPWLVPLATGKPTPVPYDLIIAIVVSGIVRIATALGHSASGALCTGRELRLLNVNAWLAVCIGAAAGYSLSTFGLAGLVWGVAIGWASRGALGLALALRNLRVSDR